MNPTTHPICDEKHLKCALGYSLRQREWTDHEMCLNGVCPMEYCKLSRRETKPKETSQ